MLVPTWMGTDMAAGNQQKHLLPSFATKAWKPTIQVVRKRVSFQDRKNENTPKVAMFADDTKVYKVVMSEDDGAALQQGLQW